MRSKTTGVALAMMLLTLAAAPVATAAPDPYGPLPPGEVPAMIRAGQFGEPGADAVIAAWLAAHPQAPKADRQQLEDRLCGDYDARSVHAAAAQACAAAAALGGDDAQSAANNALLRETPPTRAIGAARVPLILNGLGSRDAVVSVNGVSAPWIMDTGAQISVVSQSLAERIGVRRLGSAQVGSTTGDVSGGLGVIDLLRIGDATVENVPVLILPDAQLKIGELPQIQGILGLPVFVAFRRAAWLDGGKTLALGDEAPSVPKAAPRLYWHEEGVGVPLATARGTLGAHLDTGANATYLRAPAHALLDPATEASATEHKGQRGGAAGIVDTREMVYPRLALKVAGVPVVLDKVSIDATSQVSAARLGDDVVQQLSQLTLDFETMRVSAVRLGAQR